MRCVCIVISVPALRAGSFGEVFRARHEPSGAAVAVKVVAAASDVGAVERELSILRRCRSPFCVAYLGSCRAGAELWIALELCEGGSLADIMTVAGITLLEEEVAEVAAVAVLALRYLHERARVIHRDVKAGNILATRAGALKLGDFGVSAQLFAFWRRAGR